MLFSEAIREGAKLHPQAFGVSHLGGRGPLENVVVATCATGAAWQAFKVSGIKWDCSGGITGYFYFGQWETCPKCENTQPLYALMQHLNDQHRMTREWIADWLEPLERMAGLE